MPDPTPEIPVADFDSVMMGFAAQGNGAPPEAAPAPAPAQEPAPAAAEPVQGQPQPQPQAEAVVQPGAEPAPAPAPEAAPAPGSQPAAPEAAPNPTNQSLSPDIARNFRITAQDAIEQRALQIRAQDRTVSLADAVRRAHEEAGLPLPLTTVAAPAAAAQPGAPQTPTAQEPAPVVSEAQRLEQEIAQRTKALDEMVESEKLNVALDSKAYHKEMRAIQELERQHAVAVANEAAQRQYAEMQQEQAIAAAQQQARAEFPELQDANHPFALAYQAELQRVIRSGTDAEVGDPQLELKVAQRVADAFSSRYGMAVGKQVSRPAAVAPQAPSTVTQPASPAPAAAAPAPAAAAPRSAAAPISGASASVNPVMGIRQPDPAAGVAAMLQSGQAVGEDFDAMLMGAAYANGQAPSTGSGFLKAAA